MREKILKINLLASADASSLLLKEASLQFSLISSVFKYSKSYISTSVPMHMHSHSPYLLYPTFFKING